MKFNKYTVVLVIFLIFGAYLRFHHYNQRVSYGWESARDFIVSKVASKDLQLPLTGPWASIGPLTIGPWYWYYLIVSQLLIPSVYAPWIGVGIASLLTVFLMYKIGGILQDQNLGLILGFLTTISPNSIDNSLVLTNPSLVVFLTSLVILFFVKIIKGEENKLIYIIFGWLIGITLFTHYQGAGLLTLLLLFLIIKGIKEIIWPFLGLFISGLPMLAFDLNNHWFNLRGVYDFLFHTQYQLWTSMRWLTFVFDFFPKVWQFFLGGSKFLSLILMFLSVFLILNYLIRKRINKSLLLLTINFGIQVVIIRYWRGERYFGWMQFFSPFVFIYVGLLFYEFFKLISKKHLFALIIIFIPIWLFITKNSLNQSLLTDRDFSAVELKKIISELKSEGYEQIDLYYCEKDLDNNKDSVLLSFIVKKIYDKGSDKILGIYSKNCDFKNKEDQLKAGMFVDLSSDRENLESVGWVAARPQAIYDNYVKWWYREKP